jgi:hypothetical protein
VEALSKLSPEQPNQPHRVPGGYLTIFKAFSEVGKFLHGNDWTGHEIDVYSSFHGKHLELEFMRVMEGFRSIYASENSNKRPQSMDHGSDGQPEFVPHRYISMSRYIGTLQEPGEESRDSQIVPDADIAPLKRYQVASDYLFDILYKGLWAGLMQTEMDRPDLHTNTNSPHPVGMPPLPPSFWMSSETEVIIINGTIEVTLDGTPAKGWVVVKEDDLVKLLASEHEPKAPSKSASGGPEPSANPRKSGGPKATTIEGWKKDHEEVGHFLKQKKYENNINAAARAAAVGSGRTSDALKRAYNRYRKHLRGQEGQKGKNEG